HDYEKSIFSAMTRGHFRYRLPQTHLYPRGNPMLRIIAIALAVGTMASTGALAQDVKIGVVLPLTGGLAPVGKQGQAGIKLYMDKNGSTVAGKKIELIVKDDAGVPDNSKRLAQELIVNEKVAIIGSGITPSAMAIGPLSTQGKTANVVMVSGTSGVINPNNPYMVRTSFTLGQQSGIIAEWAAKNGSKKVAIVQSDWARKRPRYSRTPSTQPAGRLSKRSRCRLPTPISPRSYSVRATPTPTRCSCSCRRARPAPSPNSSPSAGSTRPASSSSAPATSS